MPRRNFHDAIQYKQKVLPDKSLEGKYNLTPVEFYFRKQRTEAKYNFQV